MWEIIYWQQHDLQKIMSNWKTVDKWAFWGRNLTSYVALEELQICVMILSTRNWIMVFLPLQRKFLSTGERQRCICSEAGNVCFSLPRSTWVPCKEEKEVLLSSTLFLILCPPPPSYSSGAPLLERGAGNLQFPHRSNPLNGLTSEYPHCM